MSVRVSREVVLQESDGTTLRVRVRTNPAGVDEGLTLEMGKGLGQGVLMYADRTDLAAFFSACIEAGFLPEAQPAPLLPDDGYPPL